MPTPPRSTSPARGRLRLGLASPFPAIAILAVFYAALLLSLRDKSAAIDEPGHAAAGYVYWKFNDYRMDPENGNLAQRFAALPYLFGGYPFDPVKSPAWAESHAMLLGDAWFNRQGHDPQAMLRLGHAASGLLAVALGFAVWAWSRRLFGPEGALVSLLLYVLCPTVLAHGALLTSDLACALGFVLATWGVAACLERVTPTRVLASSLALAWLVLAKMSAVLIGPIAALIVAVRLFEARPLVVDLCGVREVSPRSRQLGVIALVALVHVAVAWTAIWTAYGFRYSAFSPELAGPARFHKPWEHVLATPAPARLLEELALTDSQRQAAANFFQQAALSDQGWGHETRPVLNRIRHDVLTPAQSAHLDAALAAPPATWSLRVIGALRHHEVLPEAFLFGAAQVARMSSGTKAFFRGEVGSGGWAWFFPYSIAVKTPLAALALVALGLFALRKHRLGPVLPVLALATLYGAVAIASGINIGLRHLLPVLAALCIVGGAAGVGLTDLADRARRLRLAVATLLALLVLEVAARFPNYLAYFNGLVTPDDAYRHLVDSSLDWGQELPAISRYLQLHSGEPAYFAYLGLSRPSDYGIRARLIGGHLGLDWKADLPMQLLQNATRPDLARFLADHPEYDPSLILQKAEAGGTLTLLVKRPAALDLGPGLYVVSATMLQPLYYRLEGVTWGAAQEATYQALRQKVAPLLSRDDAARRQAVGDAPVGEWAEWWGHYADYRFARLAAFLRQRRPEAQINHGVLVYRLSQDDVRAALEGPAP